MMHVAKYQQISLRIPVQQITKISLTACWLCNRNLTVNKSLKIYFLNSYLDFFLQNCGEFSDEHGERFHQDVMAMEQRLQGELSSAMLGGYCWTLLMDTSQVKYSRNRSKLS
ncbi:hypothetical protein AVEN_236892-1 [Araneus ventricosus]|uniref:Uncharacterized protein n=1 Tax=Araneus ventricosus TaxID=182803 RepID=A0A4Y2DQF0_ARAVE|nr:hypothetical protein AVEN_236892-1 [Araneus ventricosus]